MKFGTKSETLTRLAKVVKSASILPQYSFTVNKWKNNKKKILYEVLKNKWSKDVLLVRSSAVTEDGLEGSSAGKYVSVKDVKGEKQIEAAIEKVCKSFDDRNGKNQIFIQPQLRNIKLSGVAFSKDVQTGAPYIVINYDDESGSTDSVTSGKTNKLKTFYFYRHEKNTLKGYLKKVISLVYELEFLFKSELLDIEFAITKNGELYLFQVRPLAVVCDPLVDKEKHIAALHNLSQKIKRANKPQPNILGSKAVYGVMPDWNPAEIIGIRPRPLALSLYKELITDNVWAYQRDNYGYRNLRSFPLLQSFYGIPYVDVRVDFNSFIPCDIENELAEKLVNYYLNTLIETPIYHDKVEFEIVYSCYTFDLAYKLYKLAKFGFSRDECEKISTSLRNLTNKIIHDEHGYWKQDLDKVSVLERRHQAIYNSDLDLVSKIYWLIEDCKRYGTLPFSGLARAAFIAVQLLHSLVKLNIITLDEHETFMQSLETVSSKMTRDFCELERDEFLKKYGHLRPGTYDILSPRYDEEPNKYFDWKKRKRISIIQPTKFKLTLKQKKQIDYLLKEHKIDCTSEGLFNFIKSAIEGREYAKFIFTKSLSDAINLFKELGKKYNVSSEDLSYSDISCISKLYSSCMDVHSLLHDSILEGKEQYKLTSQIILPPVIYDEKEVFSFHIPDTEPNFITMKKVIGDKVLHTDGKEKMPGNVLFIPSADPGYDWIFSHNIAAFITMYGGANSHMAIRAAELGIPAAIGVGERIYNRLSISKKVEIDCANKQLTVIQQ